MQNADAKIQHFLNATSEAFYFSENSSKPLQRLLF
jgi:hypothetical protein